MRVTQYIEVDLDRTDHELEPQPSCSNMGSSAEAAVVDPNIANQANSDSESSESDLDENPEKGIKLEAIKTNQDITKAQRDEYLTKKYCSPITGAYLHPTYQE